MLTQTVKDLVKDFQTVRQEFLREQEELMRQLKSGTQEERNIVRERLKERLNEWRELQKQHLKDLRDQLGDIRDRIPVINDVLEAGRPEGRGR